MKGGRLFGKNFSEWKTYDDDVWFLINNNTSYTKRIKLFDRAFIEKNIVENNTPILSEDNITSVSVSPTFVLYKSVTDKLYIANSTSNLLTVMDIEGNIITTISVGTLPLVVLDIPNYDKVYVLNRNSNNISVVDTINNVVSSTISVGTDPVVIALDPVLNKVYVGNFGSANITVINAETDSVITTISSVSFPQIITYDSINSRMYVTSATTNTVTAIDTNTDTVITSIPTGASTDPRSQVFDSRNGYLYVVMGTSSELKVLDTATNTFINTISLSGTQPRDSYLHISSNKLYIANSTSNDISIVDLSSFTEIALISLSGSPSKFAEDPINNYLYVNEQTNKINTIDTVNNNIASTITVSATGVTDILILPNTSNIVQLGETSNEVVFLSIENYGVDLRCSSNIYGLFQEARANPFGVYHIMMDASNSNVYTQYFSYNQQSGFGGYKKYNLQPIKYLPALNSNNVIHINNMKMIFDGNKYLEFDLLANSKIYIQMFYKTVRQGTFDILSEKDFINEKGN